MITCARALSCEGMKNLLRKHNDLLPRHTFISILPETMRKNENGVNWPANSDRWLSMFFEDIRPEHLPLLPILEDQFGRNLVKFNETHADAIVNFLDQCHSRPEPETLYTNCVAGISRSGAIASFAVEVFNLDRHAFHKENPQILPNNLVLYLLRERWQLRLAGKIVS